MQRQGLFVVASAFYVCGHFNDKNNREAVP
jgi:hypothetical protein